MKCIRFSRLFSLTLAVALCLSLSSCKSKEDPSANSSEDHSAAQSVMHPILPEETPIEELERILKGKKTSELSPFDVSRFIHGMHFEELIELLTP